MLKKAKAEAGGNTMEQAKELSQAVLNSSHQIWLAGLGAFSRAQAEGMKLFDNLVRQGQELESRTRQAALDTASAARGAASAKAREMQEMAGGTWDKLEQVFEDRVARALSKLGVYTQNDVQHLAERVDALSESVNRLLAQRGNAERTSASEREKPRARAIPPASAGKRGKRSAPSSTAAKAEKRATPSPTAAKAGKRASRKTQ
jgi:poly(hydroxyalkanoate) granule-associated protein